MPCGDHGLGKKAGKHPGIACVSGQDDCDLLRLGHSSGVDDCQRIGSWREIGEVERNDWRPAKEVRTSRVGGVGGTVE